MKITVRTELKGGKKYFLVYYYLPQKEGRPKKVSHWVPGGDKKAEAKANRLKRDLEKQIGLLGVSGMLPPHVYKECLAARALLQPYDATLVDAVKFYIKNHHKSQAGATVAALVKSYLAEEKKRGVSDGTLGGYVTQANAFSKKFGERVVGSLTGPESIKWILSMKMSPTASWNYLGTLKRIFTFAVSEGAIEESPITSADERRMPKKKKVSNTRILTAEEGAALFHAIPLQHRAWFTVMYFTGMRQTVGGKIPWSDVDFEERVISVSEEADKVDQERFLEGMPDRMWEILEKLPKQPKKEMVMPCRDTVQTVLAAAKKKAKITPWPRNAVRRSFASHHLNYKNPEGNKDRLTTTLVVMCHTDKPDVFWKEYFRRSRPKWADEYFDVDLNEEELKSLGID